MTITKPKRLYDTSRWRKLAKWFLSHHPLCEMCRLQGKVTPSRIVDHKIPHKGNHDLFFDTSNFQALCKTCHDSAKKLQEINGFSAGCGIDGLPLDASHPWNTRKE